MTDDHQLDEIEQTQLDVTRRRRDRRSNRKFRLTLITLGFLGFAVLAAPSIISHSGIARSIFLSQAAAYGWQASVESISVGWFTPLSVKNVMLVGRSNQTQLQIGHTTSSLTAIDLIRFDPSSIGELSLREVTLRCTVEQGGSSLESDLATLLEPSDQTSPLVRTSIQLQECQIEVTDAITQQAWTLHQSNAQVNVDGDRITAQLSGVVAEPSGTAGTIETQFLLHDPTLLSAAIPAAWELNVKADSFPLSTADLIARRFYLEHTPTPIGNAGETSGSLKVLGQTDGGVQVDISDVQIRNLQTTLPVSDRQRWQNNLATLHGHITLTEDRLHGNDLAITTDFASAELDGSFPTSISFVGTEDNPLLWMQSLQGTAKLNVDLAALTHSLPGLLPIRKDATLVSGTATAILRNQTRPGQNDARTELALKTRSIRARSSGQIVVIEPISIDATVADNDGSLLAEHFSLRSSFAEASGHGMLRNGEARFEVDFGRLYAMLRPIVDVSNFSLGGNADGAIRWSVVTGVDGDRWELGGSGAGKQLLITLPGGHQFKRSIVQTSINAKGNWKDNQLEQLSHADFSLGSGGVQIDVSLLDPVYQPTKNAVFPIKVEVDGRLENLSESLGPWLPPELASAEGRVTGTAVASVHENGGTISKADFEFLQPRINYGDQWFSQPQLTLRFEGACDLPEGTIATKSSGIVGEAISIGITGEITAKNTDLELTWKADLERLQESIGATIARAAAVPTVRPIGYRAVEDNTYRVSGRCEGNTKLTRDGNLWKFNSNLTGQNLQIFEVASGAISPPGTSAGAFQVAPALDGRFSGSGFASPSGQSPKSEVIWAEPRIKLSGPILYDPESGSLKLGAQQFACDWFAGSLTGAMTPIEGGTEVTLSGPSRIKLDLLATRLSELFGASINADGIHESELTVKASIPDQDDMTYDIRTDVGWQRCDIAGVRLGQAKLPLRITETAIRIDRSTVPVLDIAPATVTSIQANSPEAAPAQATFGLSIDLTQPSTIVQLDQGTSIQSLRISPQAAASWLKYLTPLAAGAAQVEGIASATFDECIIRTDDPAASVIRGNLEIGQMTLSSGPLANQLIQGVRQVKSMAQLTGGQAQSVESKTLIEMPPQTVPFALADAAVVHQRMYFKIDNAELMTSGRVGLDSQLALVAQVPLNANWLGSDLKGLAGQNLAFPISGTISRPRLDETAVRRVMAELVPKAGAEVIQNRLDGLIQKQLGDQVDQINAGLEKIFGF
ncbi:hypothetical protein [Roseiconus lacunae]|uniref:hypothetical protein n=1 Tax=Roseiconus lacunae TaxID=2605694 RepID=UPI0011F1543D|nr:hypothetical protein [Roseiconus lacunae]